MRVDIWSDVICPWCYVGKARFEKALDSFGHRDEVEVVYHSFELDPSCPGTPRVQPCDAEQEVRHVACRGARPDESRSAAWRGPKGSASTRERPVGNTFDVHRVLHLGLDRGVQHELLGAVNEAYFAQARDVFDRDVLTEVAAGRRVWTPPRSARSSTGTPTPTRYGRTSCRRGRSASAACRSSCSTWRSAPLARSRRNCSPARSTRPGNVRLTTCTRRPGERARSTVKRT